MLLTQSLHRIAKRRQLYPALAVAERFFSFNFAGPKSLEDILKKELVEEKNATEVADIWYTYHENKDNVHGLVLKGSEGKNVLERAKESPFFVQPVFRDDGYFMLLSQFQEPSHFLMAYLEDFKMDPARAQPLLTFSVFDDYSESKDITLVRADILNKGIEDDEGRKIVHNLLECYTEENEYESTINAFNHKPESFDLDSYISRQSDKWKGEDKVDAES